MGVSVDIHAAVTSILADYAEDAAGIVEAAVSETTKDAAKKLKASSPKQSGAYAKGWKSKLEKDRLSVTGTVYNKDRYYLAHLLENGHAKRGGGRTAPVAHIKPAEDEAAEELERRLTEAL